jgi:hypothetical protein
METVMARWPPQSEPIWSVTMEMAGLDRLIGESWRKSHQEVMFNCPTSRTSRNVVMKDQNILLLHIIKIY